MLIQPQWQAPSVPVLRRAAQGALLCCTSGLSYYCFHYSTLIIRWWRSQRYSSLPVLSYAMLCYAMLSCSFCSALLCSVLQYHRALLGAVIQSRSALHHVGIKIVILSVCLSVCLWVFTTRRKEGLYGINDYSRRHLFKHRLSAPLRTTPNQITYLSNV